MRNENSYSNLTFDYGIVQNMDMDILTYPILITIAIVQTVNSNMSESCRVTLGQDILDLNFYITSSNPSVS
jgi:hypothetical protein